MRSAGSRFVERHTPSAEQNAVLHVSIFFIFDFIVKKMRSKGSGFVER